MPPGEQAVSDWIQETIDYIEKNIVSRIDESKIKTNPRELVDRIADFASHYTGCRGDSCTVEDMLAGLHTYIQGLALMVIYSKRSSQEKAKLLRALAGIIYAMAYDFLETSNEFASTLEGAE